MANNLEKKLLDYYKKHGNTIEHPTYDYDNEPFTLHPELLALISAHTEESVLKELKLALHDTGGQSDYRWTHENVKARIATISKGKEKV